MTAKDDVDNVGAGRAAKSANPSACAKRKETDSLNKVARFFILKDLKSFPIVNLRLCLLWDWNLKGVFRYILYLYTLNRNRKAYNRILRNTT